MSSDDDTVNDHKHTRFKGLLTSMLHNMTAAETGEPEDLCDALDAVGELIDAATELQRELTSEMRNAVAEWRGSSF